MEGAKLLARLNVVLPISICIPSEPALGSFEYESDGYRIFIRPPEKVPDFVMATAPRTVRIDGVDGIVANTLVIDFRHEEYDLRTPAQGQPINEQPSREILFSHANRLLSRIRRIAKVYFIRPLDPGEVNWSVKYLNDDETELPKRDGYHRGFGQARGKFYQTVLTRQMWTEAVNMPTKELNRPWEDLLFDAQQQLPDVGPAIVLAATALETFIAQVLDALAEEANQGAPAFGALWQWSNTRTDPLKRPTLDEQYDDLLKVFTGHSLKEIPNLWESRKHLAKIRNAFVHEGVARLAANQDPVTIARAGELIGHAHSVTEAIKAWLPEGLRWQKYDYHINYELHYAF